MTRAAGPVTYPPQLARRQPRKRSGVGACSGFGRFRSERVFRNEFPYLGRVGLAAWAGFRPVGGNSAGRLGCRSRGAGPSPGPGPRLPKAKPKAAPKAAPAAPAPAPAAGAPRGRRPGCGGPAAGTTAGSADLRALDQILPQGPGRQRQAGLLHRQGRPHRVRPAGDRRRHHRARRRAEEDPARHAAARHAAHSRHPRDRRQ